MSGVSVMADLILWSFLSFQYMLLYWTTLYEKDSPHDLFTTIFKHEGQNKRNKCLIPPCFEKKKHNKHEWWYGSRHFIFWTQK